MKKLSETSEKITFLKKNLNFFFEFEKRRVFHVIFDFFEIFPGLEISFEKSRKEVNNCLKIKMPWKSFKNTDFGWLNPLSMKNHENDFFEEFS